MKKEYLKKRVIHWCHLHNCVFTLFDNGVVLIHYKEYDSIYCDLLYPSLTCAYKHLILLNDSTVNVVEYDDNGDKLPF